MIKKISSELDKKICKTLLGWHRFENENHGYRNFDEWLDFTKKHKICPPRYQNRQVPKIN